MHVPVLGCAGSSNHGRTPAPGILHPPHCFPAKYFPGERKENCKQVSVVSQLTLIIPSLFYWRNWLPTLQEVVLQLGRRPADPWSRYMEDHTDIASLLEGTSGHPLSTLLLTAGCCQHEAVAWPSRALTAPPDGDTPPPMAAPHSGGRRVPHLHSEPPGLRFGAGTPSLRRLLLPTSLLCSRALLPWGKAVEG